MTFNYRWAGREWSTHPDVSEGLLRHLVRAVTPRQPSEQTARRAGKLAREVLLAATVDRDELERTIPPGLLPEYLCCRVMPELLSHYENHEWAAVEEYAGTRTKGANR